MSKLSIDAAISISITTPLRATKTVSQVVAHMNTKSSAIAGWIAYVGAFGIGGGIGIYKVVYAPGGRRDRERDADLEREKEVAREAEDENRIREQRRMQQQLVQAQSPSTPTSTSSPPTGPS